MKLHLNAKLICFILLYTSIHVSQTNGSLLVKEQAQSGEYHLEMGNQHTFTIDESLKLMTRTSLSFVSDDSDPDLAVYTIYGNKELAKKTADEIRNTIMNWEIRFTKCCISFRCKDDSTCVSAACYSLSPRKVIHNPATGLCVSDDSPIYYDIKRNCTEMYKNSIFGIPTKLC